VGGEKVFEIGNAVAGPGGNHESRSERRPLVERLRQREEPGLLYRVDFVEHQNLGRPDIGKLTQDRLLVLFHAFVRVDEKRNDIGILRAAPGAAHHGAVEPPARHENSRRVDEDQLRRTFDRDAAYERARGLHLGRDDRDFSADQRVEERRLAGVGGADQRHEAATPAWLGQFNHSPARV
jgi:hypothetical protein